MNEMPKDPLANLQQQNPDVFKKVVHEEMDSPPENNTGAHPFDQIRQFGDDAERRAEAGEVARLAGPMLVAGITEGVSTSTKDVFDRFKASRDTGRMSGFKGGSGQGFTSGTLGRRTQFGATPESSTDGKQL